MTQPDKTAVYEILKNADRPLYLYEIAKKLFNLELSPQSKHLVIAYKLLVELKHFGYLTAKCSGLYELR